MSKEEGFTPEGWEYHVALEAYRNAHGRYAKRRVKYRLFLATVNNYGWGYILGQLWGVDFSDISKMEWRIIEVAAVATVIAGAVSGYLYWSWFAHP